MDRTKMMLWGLVAVAVLGIGYLVTRPAGAVLKNVGNAEFQSAISAGAKIVDVRTPEEYASGHIKGAINVPIDEFPQAAQSWNRDEAVAIYCATGARSLSAAQWAGKNGFRKVLNLQAGIVAWDGETTTEATASNVKVETNGKPVFIEFSSSS